MSLPVPSDQLPTSTPVVSEPAPLTPDESKKQRQRESAAKARAAKAQKAALRKQAELDAKAQTTTTTDDDEEEEVDLDEILTALDNTQSSKKIEAIHQLVTELKEMKLKSKTKKKAKKQGEYTKPSNPKVVKCKNQIHFIESLLG